jgi:hypothetical protein
MACTCDGSNDQLMKDATSAIQRSAARIAQLEAVLELAAKRIAELEGKDVTKSSDAISKALRNPSTLSPRLPTELFFRKDVT